MNIRHLWRTARQTIYAGINAEKWTNGQPVKCAFKGLVSVDLFNKANKGRRRIQIKRDKIQIIDIAEERYSTKHGSRSADFPYRRYVLCSICKRPLIGSASTGKSGKKYPAYHCTKNGHNFRISKQELETAVHDYVKNLRVPPNLMAKLLDKAEASLNDRLTSQAARSEAISRQIKGLEKEIEQIIAKIKVLNNPVVLRRMEKELANIQDSINALKARQTDLGKEKTIDFGRIRQKLKFMAEHFDELLLHQGNPIEKARLFGLLFHKLPTLPRFVKRNHPKTKNLIC